MTSLYRGSLYWSSTVLIRFYVIGVIHFEPFLPLFSLNPKVHYLHTLAPCFFEFLFSSKPIEISFWLPCTSNNYQSSFLFFIRVILLNRFRDLVNGILPKAMTPLIDVRACTQFRFFVDFSIYDWSIIKALKNCASFYWKGLQTAC